MQKSNYYLKNNEPNTFPFVIEESKIDQIIQRYHLDNIYYNLDNKNIFKRVDRFRYKKTLIFIFIVLSIGNLHEILFNLCHLLLKIDPDDPDKGSESKKFYYWNLASEFYCDIYIWALLVLSWFTFSKLKIETKIFY